MKILVTSSQGYIGSLLTPLLMQYQHEVIGVDTSFAQARLLEYSTEKTAKMYSKDICNLTVEELQAVDAVVHLAESNYSTRQSSPALTYDIDYQGAVRLAALAKLAGVHRFIYMSSCSVYGVSMDDYVTEASPVNPQTADAICKFLVEQDIKTMADAKFSPTFMRKATAFGASPRMRFDLILNNMAALAWAYKEIKMTSDGNTWRSLVHVLDICKAIVCILEAPREAVHNQVFNVGGIAHNYRIQEIAEIITQTFQGCKLSWGDTSDYPRNHRISFEKIHQLLPEFKCEWNAQQGAKQLLGLFTLIDLPTNTFFVNSSTTLEQLIYPNFIEQFDQNLCCVQ